MTRANNGVPGFNSQFSPIQHTTDVFRKGGNIQKNQKAHIDIIRLYYRSLQATVDNHKTLSTATAVPRKTEWSQENKGTLS